MPFSMFSARVLCVRPIGVTSDFCPVCRQERRFHLAQAERKRFFLCFDQGREGQPHHELTCFVCACKCERTAGERPIEILPDPKSAGNYEPDSLPIVQSRIADCVAMEQALLAGKLKGEDREEMIRYTIFSFARIYDEDPLERIKPWVLLLIVAAIFVLLILGITATKQSDSMIPLFSAFGAIGVICFALMYWVTTHSPRKRVRTWLAASLLPLDPTREEIRKARREMQASRLKAGDQIRSDKVLSKIKQMKLKLK
ncbi:MAG: hypothetical protein P1U42_01065 [Phycisphaerales bacterium]|nr:hypothetical protein [Phycisphaerales bacterium]